MSLRDAGGGSSCRPRPAAAPGALTVRRRHVLVLAPHPDDEIIGRGGTLLRLVRAGARITVLQATDGSASASLEDAPPDIRKTIRLDEASAVANAAGFEPHDLLARGQPGVRMRDELVKRLRDTLGEIRPALVFSPFLADVHPDHLTLNRILPPPWSNMPRDGMTVIGYEVRSLAPANRLLVRRHVLHGGPGAGCSRPPNSAATAMMADDFIHMCSSATATTPGRWEIRPTPRCVLRHRRAALPGSGGVAPLGLVLRCGPESPR